MLKCGDSIRKTCSIKYDQIFRKVSWLKICFRTLLTGLLDDGPSPRGAGAGRGCRHGWARRAVLLQVRLAAGLHVRFLPVFQVLLSSVSLLFLFSIGPLFFLFLPPFLLMQISFFASLLPRPLHQAGCPTSLSSAVCLFSSRPGSLF